MTELKIVSSLEKIFAHGSDDFYEVSALSMLRGERLNFQLAVRSDEPVRLTVDCDGALSLALFNVRAVPTQRAYCEDHDDDVIFSPDGIYYPDVLMPMKDGAVELTDGLTGVWCECECQKAGAYPLKICLHNDKDEVTAQAQLTVTVLPVDLPEQTLMCTHWFHCDCIATWYGVEPLSEEHWALLENYVRTAVRHGINFLLTPLFTPPLDTAVGHERPTVQLVDVTVNADGSYTFGFDKLRRWFAMAKRCGVKYFEMSHLFTQWGAAHAPKIVDVNGKKLFGWKTPAGGKAYREFLTAFAAALKPVLEQEGVRDVCYFHVSDEPGLGDLRSYAKASRLIGRLFEGFHRIDALSKYAFYEKGLVSLPVPCLDHLDDFYGRVDKLWTYYCCGPHRDSPNRFIGMPSSRNRALGLVLFKYECVGFLQWGYNFWYSVGSKHPIDPFNNVGEEEAFPAGDAYVVYPGENGEPLASLRFKVFYDGFQDLAALRLIEAKEGHEAAVALIEHDMTQPLSARYYEKGVEWMVRKREEINARIAALYG